MKLNYANKREDNEELHAHQQNGIIWIYPLKITFGLIHFNNLPTNAKTNLSQMNQTQNAVFIAREKDRNSHNLKSRKSIFGYSKHISWTFIKYKQTLKSVSRCPNFHRPAHYKISC